MKILTLSRLVLMFWSSAALVGFTTCGGSTDVTDETSETDNTDYSGTGLLHSAYAEFEQSHVTVLLIGSCSILFAGNYQGTASAIS